MINARGFYNFEKMELIGELLNGKEKEIEIIQLNFTEYEFLCNGIHVCEIGLDADFEFTDGVIDNFENKVINKLAEITILFKCLIAFLGEGEYINAGVIMAELELIGINIKE